jgi:hypothetical protein
MQNASGAGLGNGDESSSFVQQAPPGISGGGKCGIGDDCPGRGRRRVIERDVVSVRRAAHAPVVEDDRRNLCEQAIDWDDPLARGAPLGFDGGEPDRSGLVERAGPHAPERLEVRPAAETRAQLVRQRTNVEASLAAQLKARQARVE